MTNLKARELVLADIAAERLRQIDVEGFSADHDDEHGDGEMAKAAALYSYRASGDGHHAAGMRYAAHGRAPADWPFSALWWKPTDRRRDLVKAAALIVAEIERLDRAAA